MEKDLQYISDYTDYLSSRVYRVLQQAAQRKIDKLKKGGVDLIFFSAVPSMRVHGSYYILYQRLIDDPLSVDEGVANVVSECHDDIEAFWEATGGFFSRYRWTVAGVITLTARMWVMERSLYLKGEYKREHDWDGNHYGNLYPNLPYQESRTWGNWGDMGVTIK